MTRQNADHEELRPVGEATHVPDHAEDDQREEQLTETSVATGEWRYPAGDTGDDGSGCLVCDAPIPDGRTKCLFCLTNHIEAPASEQDTPDSECDILHVIHALVESRTFYGAIAKGAAATNLLRKVDADPTIDDCQLIYDLNEEPATQLREKWPSLPSAARVTSERGEQLLAAAREQTTWTDTTQSHHDGEHATFLYDEPESRIHNENRLVTLLEDADDDVWLVPAIALQQSIEETSTECPRRENPNRKHLKCQECSRETAHRFLEFEVIPDEEWTGQPKWECQVCGTPRYGSEPGEDR